MADFYRKFVELKSLSFFQKSKAFDYPLLFQHTQAIEKQFLHAGVKAGDLVVVTGPNSFWHVCTFLVAEKLGLLLCFIYDGLNAEEKDRQIQELQPNWVVRWQDDEKLNLQALSKISCDYSGCIFQTSGTTGAPGYVYHSFANLATNAQIASRGQGITQTSRILAILPFSHVGGWAMQLTAGLFTGATLELADAQSIPTWFAQLQKATHGIIVPSFYKRLSQSDFFQTATFANRPLIVTGSTVVSDEQIRDLSAKGCKVQVVYGLTEIGPYVCVAEKIQEIPAECVSILGKPNREYEMRINESRSEIEVKGPVQGQGFTPLTRDLVSLCDDDGFLSTGDLGKKVQGTYFFQGRIKNIIVVGGLKVNASELEKIILEIPEVSQCVVLAEKHSMLGEVPVAYVVKSKDIEIDVYKVLQSRVSRFKMPRRIRFVEHLPQTSIGKSRRVKDEIVED